MLDRSSNPFSLDADQNPFLAIDCRVGRHVANLVPERPPYVPSPTERIFSGLDVSLCGRIWLRIAPPQLGRIAMAEARTRAEDIETTSTRTLFELMAVSGLACSAASFWATRLDMNAVILFATAAVFGLVMAFTSMVLIRFTLEAGVYRIPKLLVIWAAIAMTFHANVLIVMLIDLSRYGSAFVQAQPLFTVSNVILAGAVVASLIYILMTLLIGCWLRWCGWRIERAPTALVPDVRSFHELE